MLPVLPQATGQWLKHASTGRLRNQIGPDAPMARLKAKHQSKERSLRNAALPDDVHLPAQLRKCPPIQDIPLHIPLQLWQPVALSNPWGRGVLAPAVVVPEATVHKDHGVIPGQNNIGPAWQAFPV
jgi:hypothetical protein